MMNDDNDDDDDADDDDGDYHGFALKGFFQLPIVFWP